MTNPRPDGGIGPMPWTPRTDEHGQPADMQLQVLPADGVVAASVVVEGRPAVVFTFGLGAKRYPPVLLLHLDGLPELVATAVEQARSHDGHVPAGPAPDDKVTCPGCGRRLFDDAALLGACAACREEPQA